MLFFRDKIPLSTLAATNRLGLLEPALQGLGAPPGKCNTIWNDLQWFPGVKSTIIHQIQDVSGFQSILDIWSRSRKLKSCNRFRVLQHDHEFGGRGIWLQKPSIHDSGRPQRDVDLWSRLRTSPTTLSNIMEITIFEIWPGRDRLGEVYGGARVWQESCAWGRDNAKSGSLCMAAAIRVNGTHRDSVLTLESLFKLKLLEQM